MTLRGEMRTSEFMRAVYCSFVLLLGGALALASADDRVQLQLNTSECDAALAILAKHNAGQPVSDADWQKLFSTEPYIRLKEREAGMKRDFTDQQFKDFLLSADTSKRAPELQRTLEAWKKADLDSAARRVLAYLPASSAIHAKVFPVIKWQTNSFVYEVTSDPAIFLYLDPKISPEQFANTIAHELHHIGLSSNGKQYEQAIASLPPGPRAAAEWMGAFGEGLAMLAAAGSPDTDPHAADPPDVKQRWQHDMANFNQDLETVQKFLLDVAEGRITEPEKIREQAFAFFGVQGPWYTVGYKMAVMVEKRFGRATLIDCMLDFRKLLASYNQAAAEQNARGGEQLALWSPELLSKVNATLAAR